MSAECMGCSVVALEDFVLPLLVTPQLKERYLIHALSEHIRSYQEWRFCPGPNCYKIVRTKENKAKRLLCILLMIYCFLHYKYDMMDERLALDETPAPAATAPSRQPSTSTSPWITTTLQGNFLSQFLYFICTFSSKFCRSEAYDEDTRGRISADKFRSAVEQTKRVKVPRDREPSPISC